LRRVDGGDPAIRCADCGFTVPGDDPAESGACFCSALPKGFKTALRCSMNSPTPESPSEFVAVEVAP
jgi:hypothetical protein